LKLYNSNFAPNPRRVRIFLAEKGVTIPRIEVDLARLEHKTAEFSALNPFQTIPVLELDDGTMISESIAICRYVEGLYPDPNLFGATALEGATVEMEAAARRRLRLSNALFSRRPAGVEPHRFFCGARFGHLTIRSGQSSWSRSSSLAMTRPRTETPAS
jgi:hypothetical protein